MAPIPPLINDVATGKTPEYPDIQPLDLELPPERVLPLAVGVAEAMPGWRRIQADSNAHSLRAEAVTRLVRFVDDVSVTVEPRESGGSRVHMRSRSRVGKGDFGANAKRIRRFLGALERAAAEHRAPGTP